LNEGQDGILQAGFSTGFSTGLLLLSSVSRKAPMKSARSIVQIIA
jgi:hypothetical protein